MNYRRGQHIVLYNEDKEEHRAVKVIQYDSMQGWLAESSDGDWNWYHETGGEWGPVTWKYVKRAGT